MKLLIIGFLIYTLYKITIGPMLSNKKHIDSNQWDQEETEDIDFEEIDEQ